jgi:nucleoside-diphosphate-sugar epimerase
MGITVFAGAGTSHILMKTKSKDVVIIGASGFIGEYLLKYFSTRVDFNVKALVFNSNPNNYANIRFLKADLLDPNALDFLLSENCIVFNLAYLRNNNLEAMLNLTEACKRNKVCRLIHCSSAVVVGNVSDEIVNEDTKCFPVSEYEKTKLDIEKLLVDESIGNFELAILRPTAVFGQGGKNLLKLANNLNTKNGCSNYIRSCLFNRRSMNLVSVENVLAALIFLFNLDEVKCETFIISDDHSTANNYHEVEKKLMASLGKKYLFPIIPVPKFILIAILYLAGKPNRNPLRKFNDQKLKALGFKKPQDFELAVEAFAEWYKVAYA